MDILKDYEKALTYYEASIDKKENKMNAYINVAFIYWQSAYAFGWADYFKISSQIRKFGIDKSSLIIDETIKLFPNNPEPSFWKRYLFHYRLIGDLFPEEEVIKILKEHDEYSAIPYFLLYLYEENKFKTQRNELLIECNNVPTAKNLYIKSIIEDRPFSSF